jgi:hypothetical protein
LAPDTAAKPINLRDYLLRYKPMRSPYPIILAENATQVYRDADYHDLITLEEDLARIAAIVLVIAESAGSLAELGAFASNEYIKPVLRVVIQEEFYKAESFVRYGPIQRIKNDRREYVGVYPWGSTKNGKITIRSVRAHLRSITSFINSHVKSVPQSRTYNDLGDAAIFYLIYWIIFLSLAVSKSHLYEYVRNIRPHLTDKDIRNKIYCMQLAGWVDTISYGAKDYFIVLFDDDPFSYSFKPGTRDTDSKRRKMEVTTSLRRAERIERHILETAAAKRKTAHR